MRNLVLDYMLPEGLILVSRTAAVVGDVGPLQLAHFGLLSSLFG